MNTYTYTYDCLLCKGAGTIISEKRGLLLIRREICPECNGTGKITTSVNI